MKLFHGSNVIVKSPRIIPSLRAMDFGAGFYLTSNKSQAERWANNVVNKRKTGMPIVNEYEFDATSLTKLKVLSFQGPDENWLDFVVQNRKKQYYGLQYDIVIGPVANDTTIRVVNDYMSGYLPKYIAIEMLMPQKLTDQYAFLSEES